MRCSKLYLLQHDENRQRELEIGNFDRAASQICEEREKRRAKQQAQTIEVKEEPTEQSTERTYGVESPGPH